MINPKETTLNFLDLETTGMSYGKDRIIEVYVSKVKNGEVISRFHSLVNPEFNPGQFILKMTNINLGELRTAPKFDEIADDLYDYLEDEYIVAHNARFDYSFLKSEFARYGISFNTNYCCTVKLSRLLFPQYKRHGLDHIIQRMNLEDGERHRAEYDTEVVKKFFFHSMENYGEKFLRAFELSIKKSSIPESLMNFNFKTLPEAPGIYFFYGDDTYPLYIGMSHNIRRRVMEHLYNDTFYEKDSKINQQTKNIKVLQTSGILGAMLRESHNIKLYQPLYNRMLRHNKSFVKLIHHFNDVGYSTINTIREDEINIQELDTLFGVSGNIRLAKGMLQGFVKEHGLCPKLLNLEKGSGACFSYQLGQCKGACIGKIKPEEYNKLFDKAFERYRIESWPFKSAIKITENDDNDSESFLFYKWCFLGSTKGQSKSNSISSYSFNLDTYKILLKFLNKNSATIEEVDLDFVKLTDFTDF